MKRNSKRGLVGMDIIVKWLIALGVLVLMIYLFITLTDNSSAAAEFFRNLIRWGR